MLIKITIDEARKIVEALEDSIKKGFIASEAILRASEFDDHGNIIVKYDDCVIYKAHKTEPHLNWDAYEPTPGCPRPAMTDSTKPPNTNGYLHGMSESAHNHYLAFQKRFGTDEPAAIGH